MLQNEKAEDQTTTWVQSVLKCTCRHWAYSGWPLGLRDKADLSMSQYSTSTTPSLVSLHKGLQWSLPSAHLFRD